MLEQFKAKYAGQTLFDVAAHALNEEYKKEDHAKLRNIEDQILANTDIFNLSEYIDALIQEVDFTILNVDEFLNSIDDAKYTTTHIYSGLNLYNGFYMKEEWQNCKNAIKFITYILVMSKHWQIDDKDIVFKDDQSKQRYYR